RRRDTSQQFGSVCFQKTEQLFDLSLVNRFWVKQTEMRAAQRRLRIFTILTHAGSGKVVRQDLLKRLPSLGHHVRSLLAQAQTVSETTSAKYKFRSRSRNVKARAFQQLPTEGATDNQLEFPTIYGACTIANNRHHFGATGLIGL